MYAFGHLTRRWWVLSLPILDALEFPWVYWLISLPLDRWGGVHARLNAVYLNCLGSYASFARSSALPYGPNQISSPSGSGISMSSHMRTVRTADLSLSLSLSLMLIG